MNKDKVLVLGNGMLGNAFKRHGYEVVGREAFDWDWEGMQCDVARDAYIHEHNKLFEPFGVIINCIGKSDTRWCEDPANFDELMGVNAELPRYLSTVCEGSKKKFVHISTGCVYDTRGQGKAYEYGFLSAHCRYVIAKWAGECYMRDEDLIIRPRLLFDSDVARGRNNLIQKLPEFPNYLDEFNSVTSCDTIVESVGALLEVNQAGVFNVANRGTYTMYEMAKALGLDGGMIAQEELHQSQGLFLVNNVMDTERLEEFYCPRDTIYELKHCCELLLKNIDNAKSV